MLGRTCAFALLLLAAAGLSTTGGRNVAAAARTAAMAPVQQSQQSQHSQHSQQPGARATEDLLEAFWKASSREERATAASLIGAGNLDVFEVFDILRRGRSYSSDVKTGRRDIEHRVDGAAHPAFVMVPDDYDATRRYPLRFFLHGGIGRAEIPRDGWWRNTDRVIGSDYISVFPASWNDSRWWHPRQLDNLAAILATLKRDYNVDENNVHMFGVSDGGTGVYYFAFRDPTPWAGFLPFLGHPSVLSNPSSGTPEQLHVINLINRPFYIVNGGTDRLYPVAAVRPYIVLFQDAGVELAFVPKPEYGHTVEWWPQEAPAIERFIARTGRDPLPDRVSWETEDPATAGRMAWIVIDELGETSTDSHMPMPNVVSVNGRSYAAFPYEEPSGRVEVERSGNTVLVRSSGVQRYRLLRSPDEFDFSAPVTVITNDNVSFESLVEPSLATLLHWAVRDDDRTMLFAAELAISLQ